MNKITTPGIYSLTAEEYHGDCCDSPHLSSSGAFKIWAECAAKWWEDSYLNPNRKKKHSKEFDLGTAGHLIVLEPELFAEKTVDVQAEDYRTLIAQLARDNAYAQNKTPLLPKHKKMLTEMREVLFNDPLASKILKDCLFEQSYFARDPETGIWIKARADIVAKSGAYLADFKTSACAHPDDFEKAVWNNGYFVQDPWYRNVIGQTTGQVPENFWFIVQEKEPPYLVSVNYLDAAAVSYGERVAARATRIFAECVDNNRWPGYSDKPVQTRLPGFAQFRLAEMEENGGLSLPDISDKRMKMVEDMRKGRAA